MSSASVLRWWFYGIFQKPKSEDCMVWRAAWEWRRSLRHVLLPFPPANFSGLQTCRLLWLQQGQGLYYRGWRSVPGALLEKELRFKFLAFLDGGQAILTTIVTVAIAWWGAGYWALVLGGLVGNAGGTAVLLICRSVRPAWPSVESLREAVQLSSHVLVNRLSWHIASSSDVFVGGRMLGQGIIGAYSFSSTIASMPMEKVTSLVSRVMPAFYSSVQSDPAAVRRYLLLLTEAVSLITFPVALGMALEADDFVRLVFGEKWVNAIAPLQILAAWAAVRSVIGLVAPVTYVTGGSRIAMLNGLLCVALFPIGFFVGSHWGAVGLAWVWVFVQPVAFIQLYKHVLRVTGLSFLEYLQPLRPALSGVVVMVIGIMGFRYSLSSEWPMAFRLTAESLIGASFYGASMFAFHRDRLRQLFVMIKKSRQ